MKGGERLGKIWRRFFPKKEEAIPEKVAILIDGENLYNSLVDLGGVGIDFGEFKERLTEGKELARPPIYYRSVDMQDPEGTLKTLGFFHHLESKGYEVKVKPLLKGKQPKSEIDPWISDGIYRSAIDSEISTIILVSGDRHFVPAVEFAKQKGKKVKVVSSAPSLSEQLKSASDEYIDLKDLIDGISRSKIEQKREQALERLNRGKRITLSTFEESP